LEFVKRRRNWRLDRVYFYDEAGELGFLPGEWTDLKPVDVFVAAAAGRAPFRAVDLLELADRIGEIRPVGPVDDAATVQRFTP
jgi:hypothetical protein